MADIRDGSASGEGNDILNHVEGLIGSPFGDTLLGDYHVDFLIGAAGDDTLHGRGESDFVLFPYATGPIDLDLQAELSSGEGTDTILRIENAHGSPRGDTLRGTPEPNYLDGAEGTDTIDGRGGGDACIGEVASNCEETTATGANAGGRRRCWRQRGNGHSIGSRLGTAILDAACTMHADRGQVASRRKRGVRHAFTPVHGDRRHRRAVRRHRVGRIAG